MLRLANIIDKLASTVLAVRVPSGTSVETDDIAMCILGDPLS